MGNGCNCKCQKDNEECEIIVLPSTKFFRIRNGEEEQDDDDIEKDMIIRMMKKRTEEQRKGEEDMVIYDDSSISVIDQIDMVKANNKPYKEDMEINKDETINEMETGKDQHPISTSDKIIHKTHNKETYTEAVCTSMNFGISSTELTIEQKKLLSEAKKKMKHFYKPHDLEMSKINHKLLKIPLHSIVPEYKLISDIPPNEVLFTGELRKLISYEIKSHKPQMYSSRFCTLSRETFCYYKSIEQYLMLNKPLCSIHIKQITKISFIKTKKTSKEIDHIMICNKGGIIKEKKDIKKSNQFEPFEKSALENNESLLIFTSEIEEIILKWYLIINYFLKTSLETEPEI